MLLDHLLHFGQFITVISTTATDLICLGMASAARNQSGFSYICPATARVFGFYSEKQNTNNIKLIILSSYFSQTRLILNGFAQVCLATTFSEHIV